MKSKQSEEKSSKLLLLLEGSTSIIVHESPLLFCQLARCRHRPFTPDSSWQSWLFKLEKFDHFSTVRKATRNHEPTNSYQSQGCRYTKSENLEHGEKKENLIYQVPLLVRLTDWAAPWQTTMLLMIWFRWRLLLKIILLFQTRSHRIPRFDSNNFQSPLATCKYQEITTSLDIASPL